MTIRTVSIDLETGAAADVVRRAIATLPLSLSLAEHGSADIHVADGTVRAGGRVLDATPWATNPAMTLARQWCDEASTAARLESTTIIAPDADGGVERAFHDHVAGVEALLGPCSTLRIVSWNEHGYIVMGEARGIPVALSATVTSSMPAEFTASLLTHDGDVTVVVPAWDTAAPARLSRTDETGTQTAPSIYETGMREVLRRALGNHDDQSAELRRRASLIAETLAAASVESLR